MQFLPHLFLSLNILCVKEFIFHKYKIFHVLFQKNLLSLTQIMNTKSERIPCNTHSNMKIYDFQFPSPNQVTFDIYKDIYPKFKLLLAFFFSLPAVL